MPPKKSVEERTLTAFGERIMKAALEAGFTQTSLERAAKFSTGYLTKILYRPQNRIDLSNLETLCELLSVRVEWLAFGKEPMREGGPRSPVQEAIATCAPLGVTADVFWYVRARDKAVTHTRTAQEWIWAFLEEHKKRELDPRHAHEARRIAMPERAPKSEPKPESLKATSKRAKAG